MRLAILLFMLCLLPMAVVADDKAWVLNEREDLVSRFNASPENTTLLKQLTQLLEQRGTHLVIAYLPLRGMALNEQYGPYNPASALEAYHAQIKILNEQGVAVVGATEISKEYFEMDDSHWSALGASHMANNLANYIQAKSWLFVPQQPQGAPLLDNPAAARITLVGTSFSDNKAYETALYNALGQPNIWNAAIKGGALDFSLVSYLGSRTYRDEPPKFLIWEIPGYYGFNSHEMTVALRRAIGAAAGDCNAIATIVEADGNSIKIADQALAQEKQGQTYLVMHIPMPMVVEQISIEYSDRPSTVIAKPYIPLHQMNFFYLLPSNLVSLNIKRGPPTAQIEVKLCGLK